MHTIDCIMVIFVTFEILNIRQTWAGEGEMQDTVASIMIVADKLLQMAENGGVVFIPHRKGGS